MPAQKLQVIIKELTSEFLKVREKLEKNTSEKDKKQLENELRIAQQKLNERKESLQANYDDEIVELQPLLDESERELKKFDRETQYDSFGIEGESTLKKRNRLLARVNRIREKSKTEPIEKSQIANEGDTEALKKEIESYQNQITEARGILKSRVDDDKKNLDDAKSKYFRKNGQYYQIARNTFEVADNSAKRDIVLSSKPQGGLLASWRGNMIVGSEKNQIRTAKEAGGELDTNKVVEIFTEIRALREGLSGDITAQGTEDEINEALARLGAEFGHSLSIDAIAEKGGIRLRISGEGRDEKFEHFIPSPAVGQAYPEGTRFEGEIRAGTKKEQGRSFFLKPIIDNLKPDLSATDAAKSFFMTRESFMVIVRSFDNGDKKTAKERITPGSMLELAQQLNMSWDDFMRQLRIRMALVEKVRSNVNYGRLGPTDALTQEEADVIEELAPAFNDFLITCNF